MKNQPIYIADHHREERLMFGKIRKLWNKFVGPWEAYAYERPGWDQCYVFYRKIFGVKQYVSDYFRNPDKNFTISTSFFLKEANKFYELTHYEKDMIKNINNPLKHKIKLTKVEIE